MLGPEYLAEAGDLVGAVYTQIEDEMLRHLCGLMLSGAETLGQRGETALLLLAQTRSAELMAIAESHRGDVSRAVRATVEDAIARSDAADLEVLGDAAAGFAAATAPVQARLTARGIAEVLARDNVDMRRGALALWNSAVAGAATKVNTGAATADRAVHEAVREMMREGIGTVSYRDAETGRRTVTNRVDVAVRRHVRTQLHQDGMRRTEALCRESGCQLVEVSSHSGARPSHAAWQGEVYGLDGPCEVGGKRYRGLADATGYGSVDGLGGANCRHSFGPWLPGTPRVYEREPEHPSGLPNDEVYRLEQGQRRRERAIRQAKRDLAGAQMVAEKDGSLANIAEVERAKARLTARQRGMRDYIAGANAKGRAPVLHRRPKREWAGDMPRVRRSDASRRTMGEFLGGNGAKRALKARGLSEGEAKFMVASELGERGIPDASWKYLSKSRQRELFSKALKRRKPTARELKYANAKPVNEALYNSLKNYVIRHGGVVMRGGDEVERHLDSVNADAGHLPGIIFLRERATTSDVLEEVFHFKQEERGDYSEFDDTLRELLRERDAQRYLLGVTEQYNIPKSEVEQTKEALSYYLDLLAKRGVYDD